MRSQAGFFDIDERLKEISAKGDDLERLNAIINRIFTDYAASMSPKGTAIAFNREGVPRPLGVVGDRRPFTATAAAAPAC